MFFTLSAFEAYLGIGGTEKVTVKITPKGFQKSDDVLGYKPAKNLRVKAKNMRESEGASPALIIETAPEH